MSIGGNTIGQEIDTDAPFNEDLAAIFSGSPDSTQSNALLSMPLLKVDSDSINLVFHARSLCLCFKLLSKMLLTVSLCVLVVFEKTREKAVGGF